MLIKSARLNDLQRFIKKQIKNVKNGELQSFFSYVGYKFLDSFEFLHNMTTTKIEINFSFIHIFLIMLIFLFKKLIFKIKFQLSSNSKS
jgi:hypothetical protein